ncbi:hypothetical protein [Streptomyces sp. NPDC051704]|uniref:hypothetical protein n=1 Tax=Streptomyces sp. NPDC051704 TaxID=3365671 RepID=UPI0037A8A8B8
MRHHHLVVIGAGSGNAVVADSFAGLDVAIVEERRFGGPCPNAGCIPGKMPAYTAHVARTVRDARVHDVDAEPRTVRWRAARDRVLTSPYRIHPALTEVVEKALLDPDL